MIFRNKKLNAFMTGSLVALVAFGYPSQLLAQSNSMDGPIQGVTSTTQEAPTTAEEINDVMTGLGAGVDIGDLIEPKPDPVREHTAFMSSMWDVLLDSDYVSGTSSLTTGEWITGPTGTVTATNETGNTLSIDIALSLEILPEEFSFIDQASLDALASVSARYGMAWTTMTNTDQVQADILVWWFQWSDTGSTHTALGPLTTVTQDDIVLWNYVVPLMNGFFDDPLNYNIDNYDPAIFSIWSDFRNAVVGVTILGVASIAVATIEGTAATSLAVAATVAGGPVSVAIATTAVVSTAVVTSAVVVGVSIALYTAVQYQDLLDKLEAAGVPTDGLSFEEIVQAARDHSLVM